MGVARGLIKDVAAPAVVYVLALGLVVAALVTFDQRRQELARSAVQERTAMGSRFITEQIDDLVRRSGSLAERTLRTRTSNPAELDQMVRGLGLQAAAVFTADGVPVRRTAAFSTILEDSLVLDLWSRVGQGLSPMGLVAQDDGPTVFAYLVPVRTAAGDRIFGGVVNASENSLGRYLSSGVTGDQGTAVLLDERGAMMATSAQSRAQAAQVATALGTAFDRGESRARWAGTSHYLTVSGVPGVEWRFVIATPEALLDPAAGARRAAIAAVAAALALLGVAFVSMAVRARRARRGLAESAVRLAEANQELEAANLRISGLVEMVSHDVRQPLGTIIGYTELAQDEADPFLRGAHLRRVSRAARTAHDLLDDTLALTCLDAGAAVARTEPIDLQDLVIDVAEPLFGLIDPDVLLVHCPVEVQADRRHLRQVLGNLLGNAQKYGAAPYAVSAHAEDGQVQLIVSDSGPGVPASFVPHLFERYSREGGSDAAGSGIGLAIVDELVRANHGSIAYRPGPGATFVVTLPGTGVQTRRSRTAQLA